MAFGKYQDGVCFINVKKVPERPEKGVVARLYGRAEPPSGGQNHIPPPPKRLYCCLQEVQKSAEEASEIVEALL